MHFPLLYETLNMRHLDGDLTEFRPSLKGFCQHFAPQGNVMFETNNYFSLQLSEHKNDHFE
jgi:hypothetical protein